MQICSDLQCDDFPVSQKVALQLCGLQAQVALGNPKPNKLDYYQDVDAFLPYRISRTRQDEQWVSVRPRQDFITLIVAFEIFSFSFNLLSSCKGSLRPPS